MAKVTIVSESYVSSLQGQYQGVISKWSSGLAAFRQKQQQKQEQNRQGQQLNGQVYNSNQEPEIKITDGDQVVYGKDGDRLVNDLNSDIIGQLTLAKESSVGEMVGVTNKKVELDGIVILQTNEEGVVKVNAFDEQQLQGQQQKVSSPIQPQNQAFKPKVQPVKANTETRGGLYSVRRSVQALEDTPLKKFLQSQVNEMRMLRRAQKQKQEAMQSEFLSELIEARMLESKQPSWWEKVVSPISEKVEKVKNAVSNYHETSRQKEAAATLVRLINSQASPGQDTYESADYTIHRKDNSYAMRDKKGKELIKFRAGAMGVTVQGEPKLNEQQYQEISQVKKQLDWGQKPEGKFQQLGASEADYFSRVKAVADTLVEYAQSQGNTVQVEGKLNYNWRATPNGDLTIAAKDRRGTIFSQQKGQFMSQMTQRDLSYFEQALKPLMSQAAQRLVQPSRSSVQSLKSQSLGAPNPFAHSSLTALASSNGQAFQPPAKTPISQPINLKQKSKELSL
ncbi:hypothetical protein BJP34_04850 [Moorena producens PAL-8-15-08-1]|uniref:Uncharacterized protein n=1 Tax=Moorena producens PAL-8-15-08-1 TaxID=1458985 RepID=A0A1D8TMI9_9CYAN|nr:hypothetical protein [Moorena producens]AOW98870.1 hypothetical protein BJP34_04850 [Moorena producens PAL-8-15-08-1]